MQITLKTYEALGRAGGMLSHYLNDVLAHLPGNEEALAKNTLKEFVRSDGMKQVLRYKTLAARVEAQRDELDDVLSRLVNARLLRRDETAREITYELVHEYLTTEIAKWTSLADQDFKQAEELLERELASWRIHRTLIPRSRLEVLYPYRERFKGLDTEAWGCLLSSAITEDFAVADWTKAAGNISKLVSVQIQVLKAAYPYTYRRGNEPLGEIGDPHAVELLIAALEDGDYKVREWAVETLGEIGDPRAVEPLIAASKDYHDGRMRYLVVQALGKMGGAAVEPLIAALKGSPQWWMLRIAVEALGEIGDPRAVEPLIAALKDELWRVSGRGESSVQALGKMGGLLSSR